MAKLGKYNIGVVEESSSFGVNATEHPVEKGVSFTDHVERELDTFSISGKITGKNAVKIESYLKNLMNKGTPITYVGRSRFTNVLITSIDKKQNSKIANGFAFTINLKEIRIAKSSVVRKKKKSGGTKGKKSSKATSSKKRYYTVRDGDNLWNIAKKYYGKPDYRTIYRANSSKIKNVNLIYPGQRFLIPYK